MNYEKQLENTNAESYDKHVTRIGVFPADSKLKEKRRTMRILFIGGTGAISPASVDLSIARGYEVYVLNRGNHMDRISPKAKLLKADYTDEAAVNEVLGDLTFDVVADFHVFTADDLKKAVRLFENRTKQYFFISSGTVYRKPLEHYIITEDAPLGNVHSFYARNKLAAEYAIRDAIAGGFPGVIVRPSLTYADWNPIMSLRGKTPYSVIHRMRRGKEIIVQGDGTSLWTITHNTDFAKGFVGLFGNEKAIGEAFHITQDEVLDWNRIYTYLAHAAGVEARIVHIATDYIGEIYPELKEGLAGDHSVSAVFDNTKIKSFVPDFKCTVPFEEGAKRCIAWFDADPANREIIDPDYDVRMDNILAKYRGQI